MFQTKKLTEFEKKVLKQIKKIPFGRVTTYAHLSRAIHQPKAFRAVANALAKNPHLIKVPCHRVVRSNGQTGGYVLGQVKKMKLLKKEGLKFSPNNKIKTHTLSMS